MAAMGQRIQTERGTAAGRPWLSLLIEAMEQAARTDLPVSAGEAPVPTALSLQLAQPASTCSIVTPRHSPRN